MGSPINYQNVLIRFFLMFSLGLPIIMGFGQEVENIPEAFDVLSPEPEIILIGNPLKVPTEEGHFQGVQLIDTKGTEKLLISGSSLTTAYILQVDLATRKTEKLIPLMKAPYRHAGGIQVSHPYLIVGIEDNFNKTVSKVRIYDYANENLYNAIPDLTLARRGEAKRQTAGATGLLNLNTTFLAVVANWDSRNWDFYHIDPKTKKYELLESFVAPKNWPSYQSINLIKDEEAIYAIGFYQKEATGQADLIRISTLGGFRPIPEQVATKSFNCKNGTDFSTAAGLQVDKQKNLHLWATQKDALKQITVNKFSQK